MKLANVVVSTKQIDNFTGELFVIPVWIGGNEELKSGADFDALLEVVRGLEEFTGKNEESLLFYPSQATGISPIKSKRVLLVGLGKEDKISEEYEIREQLRVFGGIIADYCKKAKIETVGIKFPEGVTNIEKYFGECVVEGILLGEYNFTKYKKDREDEKPYPGLKKIEFFCDSGAKKLRKGCNKGVTSALVTRRARDMANEPGNGWTAADFARYAKNLAKETGLKCSVFDKQALGKMGMGGIIAVNQGSQEPARMIVLDYNPSDAKETFLFVGKGLTFDSGGISLKPAQGMMDMKYDMCGGAAALAVMEAVASEKPACRVVAIVPSTDNMGGGGAVKPGDIITHYNGITSEVENTDAEGRLILADALAYGIEKYKPTCVIDLATLTGAVIIALGHHHTGLMCNNATLAENILQAGKDAGEPLWQLPLGKEYAKQLKSQVADVKNTGGRPGGAITAAEYLHKFVGDTPWAHLDIAGTAWDFTEKTYIPKGPSGTGARTLLYFVRDWKSDNLS